MLIGLPPFLIIRFVPFRLLMETRMAFRKKSRKILQKIVSSLYTHGKGKNSRFFRKIHIIFITGLFAPTPNSWERSKVNLLCKKVFILILNSQENAEIKDFEKIFFYSSLISLGKVQKVNHITKILGFFISLTLNSRESEKMKGFAKIFFSSTGRSLKRQK